MRRPDSTHQGNFRTLCCVQFYKPAAMYRGMRHLYIILYDDFGQARISRTASALRYV